MIDVYLLKEPTSVQATVLFFPWGQDPGRESIETVAPSSTVFADLLLQKNNFVPLSKTQERQIANEALIRSFQDLPPGWNGYDAKPIPRDIALRAIRLLRVLHLQPPEIFPTGRESIQLEYDLPGKSLEIEIKKDTVHFLLVQGEESREWIDSELESVVTAVTNLHASDNDKRR